MLKAGKVFNLKILSCTGCLNKDHISISVLFRAKHCTIIIRFVCFFQGIEIRYSAQSAFTVTSLVIFMNLCKELLIRHEIPLGEKKV